MPKNTLPTAILIADSDTFLDGGSMLLQTQTASGKKRSYLRLRSLDAQGTPDYNRLTDERANAHRRRKIRAICPPARTARHVGQRW